MKKMDPRIDWAQRKARTTLEELDVRSREDLTVIEDICSKRGVAVRAENLKSFDGVLIRHRRLIVYKAAIPEIGRQRFTIAHELGHWEMHPGLDQITACTSEQIQGYKGSSEELEANAFAAEILMPSFILADYLKFRSPTIETAIALAEAFQTSFTASALRIVQLSKLPVFVAFSSNGKLRWHQASPSARDYSFLPHGTELHDESLARYSTAALGEPSRPEHVDPEAWFPRDQHRSGLKVYEESVELGDYGVTVSFVTVDD